MVSNTAYSTRLRYDGTIPIPYQFRKKGGLLHKVRHVEWTLVGDAAVAEPIWVLWLKAPKKPVQVVVHRKKEGSGFWAEAPKFPDLRTEAGSLHEIKDLMGAALRGASREYA